MYRHRKGNFEAPPPAPSNWFTAYYAGDNFGGWNVLAGSIDVFLIFSKPGAVRQVKSFSIFDRWGEAIFERRGFLPNDPDWGWDGRFRGRRMNPGLYVWLVEIEFLDGELGVYKGDVLLVR